MTPWTGPWGGLTSSPRCPCLPTVSPASPPSPSLAQALGFLNPLIYKHAAAFNDIDTGSNGGCRAGSGKQFKGFPALKGWVSMRTLQRMRTSSWRAQRATAPVEPAVRGGRAVGCRGQWLARARQRPGAGQTRRHTLTAGARAAVLSVAVQDPATGLGTPNLPAMLALLA